MKTLIFIFALLLSAQASAGGWRYHDYSYRHYTPDRYSSHHDYDDRSWEDEVKTGFQRELGAIGARALMGLVGNLLGGGQQAYGGSRGYTEYQSSGRRVHNPDGSVTIYPTEETFRSRGRQPNYQSNW